jgi:hypothetical protein
MGIKGGVPSRIMSETFEGDVVEIHLFANHFRWLAKLARWLASSLSGKKSPKNQSMKRVDFWLPGVFFDLVWTDPL